MDGFSHSVDSAVARVQVALRWYGTFLWFKYVTVEGRSALARVVR